MKAKFLILYLLISFQHLTAQESKFDLIQNFVLRNVGEAVPDFTMDEQGTIHYFQIKNHDFNILSVKSMDNIKLETYNGYNVIRFNGKDMLIFQNADRADELLNAFKSYFKMINEQEEEKVELEESLRKAKADESFVEDPGAIKAPVKDTPKPDVKEPVKEVEAAVDTEAKKQAKKKREKAKEAKKKIGQEKAAKAKGTK